MVKILTLKLLIALGNKQSLHKKIDEVYAENKLEYYEALDMLNICKSKLIYTYPSAQTERILKLAQIYSWCLEKNNFRLIEMFIELGFKRVLNYCNRTKEVFLPLSFPTIFKSDIKELDSYTVQELTDMYSVIMWLCFATGKTCQLDVLEDNIRMDIDDAYYMDLGDNFLESIADKYQESIKGLSPLFCLNNKHFKSNLDLIFCDIDLKEGNQLPGLSAEILNDFNKVRPFLVRQGLSKYIDVFAKLFNSLGVSDRALVSQSSITEEELNQIFAMYYLCKEENALSEAERDIYLIAALYIFALIKEYQNTRQVYLANVREENYLDTIKIKKQIDEQKRLLINEKIKYTSEIEQLKAKVELLQNESSRWERKATRLKQELENVESNKKELIVLREFIFNQQQNVSILLEDEPDLFQKSLELLAQKKCSVIGGHPNWIKKLKDILPHFTYLNSDSIHRDFKFLDNQELVFINIDYISHALYYKVMSEFEKNKAKVCLIRGTSFQSSITEMGKLIS